MKKHKNIIGALIFAAVVIFCLAKAMDVHQFTMLKNQVNDYETRMYNIATEVEMNLEEMDVVGLNNNKDELNVLLEEIEVTAEEYDEDSTERKMFNEFTASIEYLMQSIDIMIAVVEDPWSMLSGVPEQQLETVEKEIEEHATLYSQYKMELNLLDDIAEIEGQDL